jgi:uncharacterized protein
MEATLVHEQSDQRTFVVVLATGEEVIKSLNEFATQNRIYAAQFSAIGVLSDIELKYFDWETKKYESNPLNEQVEVASLLGDIAMSPNKKPSLHVHVVIGRRNGTAMAGHLGKAHVRPTLEVILTESPAHLRKVHDPESGLNLIRPTSADNAKRPRLAM